jgi:hypothetical protein
MNVLGKNGIEIALKKGWLKVSGEYVVGDAIYLRHNHDVELKAKKPVVIMLPQDVSLGERFAAFVEYHPELRTKGTLNGPTVLFGNEQAPIAFRFMADEDMKLSDLNYLAALVVCKVTV